MQDLKEKVTYISGGANGIGAEIARRFAEQGSYVVIGDINQSLAETTAAGICAKGGKAIALAHDVSDEAQWESAITQTLSVFSGFDILINNAGIEQTCPLADIELVDMQRQLDVNVIGTILGHKHAIRVMRPGGKAGKGGSIINLSSVAALVGTPGLGVYSATKGAVRLLSKAAAVECGRFGYNIRVNSIYPGLVKTDMGDKLVDDFVRLGIFPNRAIADEQILTTYPIGRTGVPKDIAGAALFLASDQSSWMTGGEIVLDGGMTIS